MIGISSLSFQTPSRQLAPPMVFAMAASVDAEAAAAPREPRIESRRAFGPSRPAMTDGTMAALIEAQAAFA